MRTIRLIKLLTAMSVIAVSGYFLFALPLRGSAQDTSSTSQAQNPLLKRPAFVFSYLPANFDPKILRSVTILGAYPGGDFDYWKKRGVPVAGDGQGYLWPFVSIDEDGYDFSGPVDNEQAKQLRQLKKERPDRAILVWQTPRPVKGLLLRAYKRCVDLIQLEAYAHSPKGYLVFDTEVDNMRRLGLLEKSILALGIGPSYASTKEEILQQVRYIRWIAPECAGIGTFAPGAGATPELLTYLDELCLQWDQIPTDGRDLPKEIRAIHESYIQPHEGPTLVVSGEWSFQVGDKWLIGIRNIGNRDAYNVHFRLRNHQPRPGGEVQAEGFFRRIKAGEMAVKRQAAVKGVTWKGWPPVIDVEAPGATVLSFSLYD